MSEAGKLKAVSKSDEPKDLEKAQLDLDLKKYELEKYKSERAIELDIKRYALERYKSRREQKFLNRNLGVLISAAISLSAVLVSLSQVWVAKISKDKELEVASLQKQAEHERLDKQKEKELAVQITEQERQWNLSRAKFITENRKSIFEGTPQELKRMSLIIETLFPTDIAASMFEDFQRTATTPEAERVWVNAQERIQKRPKRGSGLTEQPHTDFNPSPSSPDDSSTTQLGIGTGINLHGEVVGKNGVPLSGVKLALLGPTGKVHYRTVTNHKGKFSISSNVPPAMYRIEISYAGYAHTMDLDLTNDPPGSDRMLTLTLALE